MSKITWFCLIFIIVVSMLFTSCGTKPTPTTTTTIAKTTTVSTTTPTTLTTTTTKTTPPTTKTTTTTTTKTTPPTTKTTTITTTTSTTTNKVIFEDNFNSETTAANPSKWIVSEPAGTDISIDDAVYFGADGKSAKIQDNSATEGPAMNKIIGSQTGKFWYEVSIRLAQTNQIVGAVYIGNSAVPGGIFNIENLGVSITFWSDGYIKYNDNDNQPWKNIQTYQADKWYTVKVLVDVPNQKINLYIDDVLKLTDISFRYPMTLLDQIMFGGRAELPASTIWIDNILVTEAP